MADYTAYKLRVHVKYDCPESVRLALQELSSPTGSVGVVYTLTNHDVFKRPYSYYLRYGEVSYNTHSRVFTANNVGGLHPQEVLLQFVEFLRPYVYEAVGTSIGVWQSESWPEYRNDYWRDLVL